ncbi:hypothetical protein U8607_16335 [Methylobacterium durans]|jgi:hypothetical protein|uniref:hypothetical protein n=1 Tax=Methylobacterium durans TaxID=2202825 RepID=UPI002AFF3B26|nr:hypothetical protein [Methylobacterium durans]MEA1833653.1 hypothetical protein [Methylobacterium durans]
MRTLSLALLAATLTAGAASAQVLVGPSGPQGEFAPHAYEGRLVGNPVNLAPNRQAIFEDSAKGGNAEQTNRRVPNLGATAGGPLF